MYAMTIETATRILGRTSALGAAEAIMCDVAINDGPIRFGIIKDTIWDLLTPVNDLLYSPLHSDCQVAGASVNVRGLNGKQRMIKDGYSGLMSLDEVNEVFNNRRNFGAITIDELLLAISVATAHKQRPDAVDEIIAISTEEHPDETEPVIYEEIHSEEGVLLADVATKEVDDIKTELMRLAHEVDEQMKQISKVLDQPLPSQINNIDRLVRNRQVCGLK